MVSNNILKIFALLICLFFSGEVLAEVSAFVDRTQVSEVDTIKLVLTAKQRSAEPDLSSLSKDFDVLSQSTSSRVSFVNGKMDSTYEWNIILSPKRLGKLIIPAIGFDKEMTDSIEITVKQVEVDSAVSKDIFIEARVESKNPYVQSQLVYTIKLYHAVELQEGGLSLPKIGEAIVERLGDDSSYITTIKGRRYRVTERRYAIFPQQSGELTIPAVVFDGQVLDNSKAQSSFDPFFGRRFQSTRPVRVRSKEIVLTILPKPKSAKGKWWLPAKKLSLTEQWSPKPPQFRVGEPVTRTIILSAEGLSDAQLPDLVVADTKDFKLYPDQAKKETTTKKNTIVSRKVQKVALVPTRVGDVVIPEMHVHWWDTKNNKAMEAIIPARNINVLPALAVAQSADASKTTSNSANNASNNAANNAISDANSIMKNSVLNDSPEGAEKSDINNNENVSITPLNGILPADRFGYWFTLFFFVLWIITLVLWYSYARRVAYRDVAINNGDPAALNFMSRSTSNKKRMYAISHAKKQIKSASLSNDAKAVREQVIKWAHLVWPDNKISNLGSVIALLKQDAIRNCLVGLDRVLYASNANHNVDWHGEVFWCEFSSVDIAEVDTKQAQKQPLKTLYSGS